MSKSEEREVDEGQTESPEATKESFVYCLQSTKGATYIGATVDVLRRLRQHNKELAGGAHATSAKVYHGEAWEVVVYVSGFPTWNAALQFEWRWKQLSRKVAHSRTPLQKRMQALFQLLHVLDRATSKAVPYAAWPKPPQLHWQVPLAKSLFEEILEKEQETVDNKNL